MSTQQTNDVILTPSAAKLFPRRARLQSANIDPVNNDEPQYENGREVKNMISLWEAQKRAKELASEIEKDSVENKDNEDEHCQANDRDKP